MLDAVTIKDDGEVEGMDNVWSRVLSRYPWLVEESPLDAAEPAIPQRRTAMPPKRRTDSAAQMSQASLANRFPALKRHASR